MANAWGVAWGDSWGTSWGPLHEVEDVNKAFWDAMMAAGAAGKHPPARDYLSENLALQQKARDLDAQRKYNLTRLHADDLQATELLLSLVTEGFFDGDF